MSAHDDIQRVILPIPDVPRVGLTTYDARDAETAYPRIAPLRPPDGAPNVLIVLLDDVGFGASSAFGGPIHTPTAERLAAGGLKYTRFHTTAMWGEGHVEFTQPLSYSLDEGLDIGCESGTPVAEDYTVQTSRFTGRIEWLQLDQGADDHDHLISPEERLRLVLARH